MLPPKTGLEAPRQAEISDDHLLEGIHLHKYPMSQYIPRVSHVHHAPAWRNFLHMCAANIAYFILSSVINLTHIIFCVSLISSGICGRKNWQV